MKLHHRITLAALIIPVFSVLLAIPFFAHASVKVFTFGTDFYPILNQDTLANGGFSVYGSSPYHGTGSLPSPQAQRICYVIDPSAYPSAWKSGGYKSPSDNSVVKWDGSVWKRYGAKRNNNHISGGGLECTTDAPADTSLTASKTSISLGESSVLTWLSQYGKIRKAQCTGTNFTLDTTVPAHFETVVWDGICGGGSPFDGPRPNAAAPVCGVPLIYQVWVPDYTGPAPYGGSKSVSPTQTTTYTYTCTNANGPSSASVTITVNNNSDCTDGVDNDGDRLIDAADPGCSGTSGGTNGGQGERSDEPDLTAGPVLQGVATEGAPTPLASTISNIGGATTGTGFKNLFQIDNDADHSVVFASKVADMAVLGSSASDNTQVSYTFPTSGAWYVRVCADSDENWRGVINEGNEDNNCSSGGWKQLVVSKDAPGASLTANPSAVAYGEPTTLRWSCAKSTSASIDQGIGAVSPVAGGSVDTGPLFATTDYTLSCNGTGTAQAFTKVTVNAPTVDISAQPPLVKRGETTVIAWSSQGATSCTVSGPGLSSRAKNGSQTVTINSQSSYTITCNGISTKSITVGLVPAFNEQ